MGKLTAIGVKNLTKPGVYGDGAGLASQVRSSSARSWVLRYMRDGKAHWLGLGGYPSLSLAEAREVGAAARRLITQGKDPIDHRRANRAARAAEARRTFSEVATTYLAAHEVAWRNPKHRQQWRNTLIAYVFPSLGDTPVADITTADVVAVLQPIWQVKPETASRVRGRIEAVLSYAKAMHWRDGPNPAAWRDNLSALLPQTGRITLVRHHAALPWHEISGFMRSLSRHSGIGAIALTFAILTAARSGEVRGATWDEIDMDRALWIVPPWRMKGKREHRVPLSESALSVLRPMRLLCDDGKDAAALVFPGQQKGKPLSDMSLTAVLRRMSRRDLTVHGFRSTFRDWVGEATNHPRELAEAALAHALRDKTEAAYARGDMLDRRRRLMEEWAAFCTDATATTGAEAHPATPVRPRDVLPSRPSPSTT